MAFTLHRRLKFSAMGDLASEVLEAPGRNIPSSNIPSVRSSDAREAFFINERSVFEREATIHHEKTGVNIDSKAAWPAV